MAIYFLILLILLFFIHYKNEKRIFYFASVLLFLVFAFKNVNLGADTSSYFTHFKELINGENHYKTEPIWGLLAHLNLFFGGYYKSFQIILFACTLPPVVYVIRKDSKNYVLSLFFYYAFFYYLNAFCIVRQAMALSYLLVCFHFIKTKKLVPATIFLIIAILCHNLAILGIVAFIFYFKRFSLKTIVIVLGLAFIAGLFVNEHFLFLVPSRYQNLFLWEGHGFREKLMPYILIIMAMNIVFIICLLRGSKTSLKSFWAQTVFAGLVIMNGSLNLVQGLRISQFFMITQIIFYANYTEEKEDKQNLYKWGLIAYSSIYFVGLLYRDSIGVVPYIPANWIQNLF
ncbi:MAG: hypothetical protein BKP49_07795 [Treponema sp. CETP13]|nr:MAG: hypothetical protein BKP49_07795 [Treponema sp. CETP13]